MSKLKYIFAISLLLFTLCSTSLANPFTVNKRNNLVMTPGRSFLPQSVITKQGELKEKIAKAMHSIKMKEQNSAYFNLLLLAFIYGIFHAAGPGHRKAVVFGAFIAKKSHVLEPALAGLMLAALHVLASIILVFGVQLIAGRILGSTIDQSSAYVDAATLLILFIFIIFLLVLKIKKIKDKTNIPEDEAVRAKNIYTTMVITGLMPCPGATLILIFAASLAMYWEGISAVIAMSIGMGITISLAGYLAYFGKEVIFNRLKNNKQKIALLSDGLEILGYVLILLFCTYLLLPIIFRSI